MALLLAALGFVILFSILWDSFETMILPRRVTRRLRLTWLFYRLTWRPWARIGRKIKGGGKRENFLSWYGPLSLLLLLATWAIGLVFSFALLQFALAAPMNTPDGIVVPSFGSDAYMSGITFFTLGFGDITPRSGLSRLLAVMEAGVGFAFLGLVIGYVPVLYGAFSRREVNISLLDARAGSPPSAAELLRRFCHTYDHNAKIAALNQFLYDWERWSAELMESQLSYPMLSYFRSMHENQSWLEGLTMVLDTCTLIMAGLEGATLPQASLTFAMARHAAVDLSQTMSTTPVADPPDRLPPAELGRLREALAAEGIKLREGPAADSRLRELREMYEPYVYALATHLLMPLPPWSAFNGAKDNWQTTAWEEALSN